ncbi:MAG: PTS fructose transporter subunit IIA [Gammaproteobacteria bacterium]|nr:PTS fructose transporter subunit IIA [Gammaproteobacteria bacterium]
MNTALLMVTHNNIGQTLIDTATSMLACNPVLATNISIPVCLEPQGLGYQADRVREGIAKLNTGDGVLVLTDVYGATANNLARYFASEEDNVEVVSGVNLPMLIRVINYHQQPLKQLAVIAIEGGRQGIQLELLA